MLKMFARRGLVSCNAGALTASAVTPRAAALALAPPTRTATALHALRGAAARLAALVLFAAALIIPTISAAQELGARALEIEVYLNGFPTRAVADLTELAARADTASPAERRFVDSLLGQSFVAAGQNANALALAQRLEAGRPDNLVLATARLVRSNVESQSGDYAKANALAKQAQVLGANADPYLAYWSAITIGITARGRGRWEESLASLQGALGSAGRAQNAYRQSLANYQLSQLYLELKQPTNALDASRLAYDLANAAGSVYGMARARMAESAAMELLGDPARELAAMQEALAIARKAQSTPAESLALINLADIELRRRRFDSALDHSRRSLELARAYDNASLIATSKANMGFALFGLGRPAEGKRLADEALSDYERTGATVEIASLLGEYGQYLEHSGDFKGALDLYHRERKLVDEISAAVHQKSVLELQSKYESERRQREIDSLNRQNELNAVELENRDLQERVWLLLALFFAVSLLVIKVFHRKLGVTNGLLAQKNQELKVRSNRDPLTALYNRRYFQDFMRDEGARPERRQPQSSALPTHALLLIDIDHFKQTNDRYGHAAGDMVLVAVARRLRDTLRETDMIVRWGGEEFLVFVPATNAQQLDEIAARIMEAIAAEPIEYLGSSIRVTASIGYAPMPLPPNGVALSWERAISLVDMALYMAKLHGRNRAYGIRGLLRSDDEALESIERDLEQAWESGFVDLTLLSGPDVDPSARPGVPRAIASAVD
jgi:diguanylate cyclase (GGDEF)-like protein